MSYIRDRGRPIFIGRLGYVGFSLFIRAARWLRLDPQYVATFDGWAIWARAGRAVRARAVALFVLLWLAMAWAGAVRVWRRILFWRLAVVLFVLACAWAGPPRLLMPPAYAQTIPPAGTVPGTIPAVAPAAEEGAAPYWFAGRACAVPAADHSCRGYTATPLAGVTVSVWNGAGAGGVLVDQGVTDAGGAFDLAGVFPVAGSMVGRADLPGGEVRIVSMGWPTWPAFYYDFRYVPQADPAALPAVRVFLPLMGVD